MKNYYVMAYNAELSMDVRISPIFKTREEAVSFSNGYSIKTKIKSY